jgi:beta-aspartyl-peptidase (threonine type)
MPTYALAIHGGASVLSKPHTPEQTAAFEAALLRILSLGESLLKSGDTALDAVEATVAELEDDPVFNAGRGATLASDGRVELDASIMNGATLQAGAVAGLRTVKNPVKLARRVIEVTPYVFLIGSGAEALAVEQGLDIVDGEYFLTPHRVAELARAKEKAAGAPRESQAVPQDIQSHVGTVGAVALDLHGNLAAATSTGGMLNKQWGRVGDSPVIGAGTYADNRTCAVSATGHGEWFIRAALAHDVAARMAYGGQTLEAAASAAMAQLTGFGASGGFIAVDWKGNIALPFNSTGMHRGWVQSGEKPMVGF